MSVDLKSPVYTILFAAIVSAFFTAGIMTLQIATAEQVRRNEALRMDKALIEVFDLGDVATMKGQEVSLLVDRRIDRNSTVCDPKTGRTFPLMRAYRTDRVPGEERSDADLIGIAFPVSGM